MFTEKTTMADQDDAMVVFGILFYVYRFMVSFRTYFLSL